MAPPVAVPTRKAMTPSDEAPRRRLPALPGDLAAVRTILAADRTMMAWIRTSLAMLAFGFTIYKVLDAMVVQGLLERTQSPRRVALALCAMGVAAIVFGTISYWATLRDVARVEPFRLTRSVFVMALILSLAGIALFAGILWRLA
jgi:putative membrane protein